MEAISVISIITIALLGSFGHCIGMCGGIVVAYSSTKIKSEYNKVTQSVAHLLYSFGRVTTYTLLGAIFGFVGGVVSFSNITSGVMLLITGLMMILVGFSLLGKVKFLSFLEQTCSKSSFYQKNFKALLGSNSLFSFYLLGLLNGLLPCGFVYVFAITAASTGSAFWGAVVMFIFGISTIPALFFLGFFIGLFKQSNLRDTFIRIASILVIIFGIYIAYQGYEYIVDPTKSILNCHI
ncbi:sulfite exporter TauE/SafE family protein [Aliarcobacter cibarius]|uniref:Sulfite exporter TauE/SafE family protein n=1 Tax=Aliarcobacter cibarius TaxID=255507 RepID=A0A5J6RH43_9BACT|nr:sulfite exporter TauE/SafE family protein [Aliarcobacter cibarius]QEZ89376.1 sulfite exporter TauE/SafE family protein (DsbD_2 domain) [Aliarcobacter cibarius]QKJ27375.1 sulfite exporter TauE/SafE family protein (DsbD_2 domain) [Aliarcobacter cibarius]TLS97056.1 sulfite exporter TauE/SafE family protein [Aliarcobacter cibarius]TLS97560.1 sulfite exporter TauE/SafE family protein [Aliarcobacter cibarius]TLT04268.1 sulfite exporter TauE/SafE family protein [Aliarcobacter cibarius]